MSRSKSVLFIPKDGDISHNLLLCDISVVGEGFDLLGCPISSPAYCASLVFRRVKKVQDIISLLPSLEDSQMEATFLRMCLALLELSFSLRTCPPIRIRDAAALFHHILFESVSDLVGGSLSDWFRLKASLPVLLGGLVTCRASIYAPAAFLASLDQSKELVSGILGHSSPSSGNLVSALQDLVSGTGRDDWCLIEGVDIPLQQRAPS